MKGIDKRAWDFYKLRLTYEELANEALCKDIRKSLSFAGCRFAVARDEFIDELVKGLPKWLRGLIS